MHGRPLQSLPLGTVRSVTKAPVCVGAAPFPPPTASLPVWALWVREREKEAAAPALGPSTPRLWSHSATLPLAHPLSVVGTGQGLRQGGLLTVVAAWDGMGRGGCESRGPGPVVGGVREPGFASTRRRGRACLGVWHKPSRTTQQQPGDSLCSHGPDGGDTTALMGGDSPCNSWCKGPMGRDGVGWCVPGS